MNRSCSPHLGSQEERGEREKKTHPTSIYSADAQKRNYLEIHCPLSYPKSEHYVKGLTLLILLVNIQAILYTWLA